MRWLRSRAAWIALACLALAWSAGDARAQDPYLAEDRPEVVFSDAIRDEAQALGNDAVRIYEFVRNEFEYEPYHGLLKGPEQTLLSRAGNEYDLAALLISLLRVAGTPARFVRGEIEVTAAQASAWLGTTDGVAAANYWFWAGPLLNRFSSTTLPEGSSQVDAIRRLHVWVEAQVPLARYRGTSGGAAEGLSWVALDASYKLRDWRPDPGLPIDDGNDPSSFSFGYVGTSGYYRSVDGRMPAEAFEDQVLSFLAGSTDPAFAGKTLTDVKRGGPIRSESPGVLPTSLPYKLIDDPTSPFAPQRDAELVHLHDETHFDARFKERFVLFSEETGRPILNLADRVLQGATDYLYLWGVDVCRLTQNPSSLDCLLLDSSDGDKVLSLLFSSAGAAGERITLSFPAEAGTEGQVSPGGLDCASDPVTLEPSLWFEGTRDPNATDGTVSPCEDLLLVLHQSAPLDVGGQRQLIRGSLIEAGGTYVPVFEAYAASRAQTQRTAEALVSARSQYPLAEDENGDPFIDLDGDTLKGQGESFFSQDFDAQEALVGGLLNLARFRYQELEADGRRRIADLHHRMPLFFPGGGTAEAGIEVDVLFDRPFGVRPSNLLVDLLSGAASSADPSTGALGGNLFDHPSELIGTHGSAAEHAVWEELAAVPAISTVSGFQRMVSAGGAEVMRLTSADAGAATASCTNGLTCSDIDQVTYCLIREAFSQVEPGLFWKAQTWDSDCAVPPLYPLIPFGSNFETEELTVLDNSAFAFLDFAGFVFQVQGMIPGAGVVPNLRHAGYLIAGGAAGGFATDGGECLTADGYLIFGGCESGDPLDLSRYFQQPETGFDDWFPLRVMTPLGPSDSDAGESPTAGDPVTIFSGNYVEEHVDLEIAGRAGMNLRLVRSYNSQSDYAGPLGLGWIHTFDQHLRFEGADANDPNDVDALVWFAENGAEIEFRDDSAGGFITHPWIHHTLERDGPNFVLTLENGMAYRFLPLASERASLDLIQDRNGNQIGCVYIGTQLDRVKDTAGRELLFSYDGSSHLDKIADWTGREWRYLVDGNGDLIEYRDPVQSERDEAVPGSGRPFVYEYYSELSDERLRHNLKRWIRPEDRDGDGQGDVSMEFVYYDSDRVYRHTNSLGETTSFDYNYFRQRTAVTLPDGSVEEYFYDLYGNIVRQVSARGVVHSYEVDEIRRDILIERDGFGYETHAAYDDRGNMIQRTDRLGEVESWTYNEFSQPTSHTFPSGRREVWQYDSQGNLLTFQAGSASSLRILAEYRYDASGNRVEERRHTGVSGAPPEVTITEYNAAGTAIAWVRDPIGHAIAFESDALGRPLVATRTRSVRGQRPLETVASRVEYDALGRVVRTVDPVGTARERVFDANGRVTEERTVVPGLVDGQPVVRVEGRHSYDDADRPVQVENALGQATQFAYDTRGRVASATSPLGHEIQREYDDDGNLIATIDPTGARTAIEYDPENRPIRQIDPLGRVSTTEYDREGRVLRRFGPGDRLLSEVLDLDPDGRPLRVANGEGHAALTTYDDLGRPETVTAPVGADPGGVTYPFLAEQSTTRLAYDLQGRLLSRIRAAGDPEERTESIRYDPLGRPIEFSDPLGRTATRAYDEIGNLISSTNAAGETLLFRHDARGLVLERQAAGPSGQAVADEYAYDALGRLTVARNDTATQMFGYDALDRVVSIYDPGIGTARRVYDADGRTVQLVSPDGEDLGFADGVVTTYQYNGRGQIVSISDPVAGSWQLGYDAAGRLRERVGPGGVARSLAYTLEGFIDRVTLTGSSGEIDVIDYENYDALGSPEKMTTGEGPTTFGYDALNRLTSVDYPGVESESFVYDRLGNRVEHVGRDGVQRKYVVDAADQLQQILDALDQPLETFSYDAAGRRTEHRVAGSVERTYDYDALSRLRRVTQPASAITTTLQYDAQDARYRRDETGSPTALFFGEWMEYRGNEIVRLVHGGGLDNVLAEVVGSDVRQLLTNASNNVTHVASAAATPFERRYEAFGGVRASQNPIAVERGFAGRPTEGSTGLLYVRARHYDPATGRFLQADPLGLQGDQLYAYAASNPVVFGDPLGLLATLRDDPLSLQEQAAHTPSPSRGTRGLSQSAEPRFSEGPVIALVFRPIQNKLFSRYLHGALFIAEAGDPRTSRIEAQFSLGFYDGQFNEDPDTSATDLRAFRSPGGRNLFLPITPPQGLTPREAADHLIQAAKLVRIRYAPAGPNSNTAIFRALGEIRATDSVPLIPDALGLRFDLRPPPEFPSARADP